MKHKLLVVVLILAALSVFTVMGAQALGQDNPAGLGYTDAQYHRAEGNQLAHVYFTSGVARTALGAGGGGGIRRFRMV